MAFGIRNSCVARGSLSAGVNTTVYTVPAGYVLLLKSVVLLSGGATTSQSYDIYLAAGATYVALAANKFADASGQAFWNGWVALNGGDLLQITIPTAGFYWVSGALLPQIP